MVPVTILRHTSLGNLFQVATLRHRFGRRLREIRLSRKMSQERFAEMLGVSVDFLSLIERGRNAPSFKTLDRIAHRLRLPVAELFKFDSSSVQHGQPRKRSSAL